MKGPKPRDYGLDSDHLPGHGYMPSADPAQPFTQAELDFAAYRLLTREAEAERQRIYRRDLDEYLHSQSSR